MLQTFYKAFFPLTTGKTTIKRDVLKGSFIYLNITNILLHTVSKHIFSKNAQCRVCTLCGTKNIICYLKSICLWFVNWFKAGLYRKPQVIKFIMINTNTRGQYRLDSLGPFTKPPGTLLTWYAVSPLLMRLRYITKMNAQSSGIWGLSVTFWGSLTYLDIFIYFTYLKNIFPKVLHILLFSTNPAAITWDQ